MSRPDAVALIVRALRGDVRAAIASKREQPNHTPADWSAMCREAVAAIEQKS